MMAQIINTAFVCIAAIIVFLGFTHERRTGLQGSATYRANDNGRIYKEKHRG